MNNKNQQHIRISSEWYIDYSNPLGRGSFSVYKARKLDKINGKSISNDGEYGLKEIEMILKIEQKYGTCNEIIKYYGYGFGSGDGDNGLCYIYVEYLNGFKSIKDIINNRIEKRLDQDEIMIINSMLMECLEWIHKFNIIHRDIKCDNVLYNQDTFQIKLIDLGISKYSYQDISSLSSSSSSSSSSSFAGTLSPESRLGNRIIIITTKSDMWSLGCTLIEMVGGDLTITNKDGLSTIPTCLTFKPLLI